MSTKMNRKTVRTVVRKGLIHGIAECTACGWREENYLVVQKCASAHARTTGHRVMADLGYVVEYGSSNAPLHGRGERVAKILDGGKHEHGSRIS